MIFITKKQHEKDIKELRAFIITLSQTMTDIPDGKPMPLMYNLPRGYGYQYFDTADVFRALVKILGISWENIKKEVEQDTGQYEINTRNDEPL